jgi:Flp pilus assembly protein TadB
VAVTVVVVCSIGVGIGLSGVMAGLKRRPPIDSGDPVKTTNGSSVRGVGKSERESVRYSPGGIGRLVFPPVSALLVGIVTRWPVAALLAGLATYALPSVVKATSSQASTRRTEAVAVWTELLRDTLTASAGLAEAVVATAGVAPEELRVPVGHLADRIMSGVPMDDALRVFAIEVDDQSAYEVVCALRLAATARAHRLVDLLSALAESTRDEVTMRLRVEASRASARSSVRTVACFSIGFVALLVVVARSYLSPFGSATGQLVLVVVGACFAAGLTLMVRLVRAPSPHRPAGGGMRT